MTSERRLEDPSFADGARWVALWEVLSVVTSCLIAEWVVLAFFGRSKFISAIPVILAIGLMVYSHRERGETYRDIGFRMDNFVAACRLLALPTALAILVIALAGWLATQQLAIAPFRPRFLWLPFWALFQQYVLNGFINRRIQIVTERGIKSALIVGVIFGLLHLPNPFLAVLTFLGGTVWAFVFQREPNLFALALSHSLISLALAVTGPSNLLNSLRVGFKYFG